MKRLFYIVLGVFLFLLTGFCFLCWKHYYLWPNSVFLFQLHHRWTAHLAMYTDRWTYQAGDTIQVYASTHQPGLMQMSLYPILNNRQVLRKDTVEVEYQSVPDEGVIYGMDWKVTAGVEIPIDIESGWYILEASSNGQSWRCSIFIEPKPEHVHRKIALLLSTNTWNAYNHWGGQSLYTKNYTFQVSFNRPQLLADPELPDKWEYHQLTYQSASKDRYVVACLNEVGLETDVYAMSDLEESGTSFYPYDVLIISTHAEYWTKNMLIHLNEFLEQGGSLLCLSGNTAAYVSHLDLQQRSLEVHKSEDNLWLHADSTGLRPFGSINYVTIFQQYAPYKVITDTSWVIKGTGLEKGDLFGTKSDTYDYTLMFGSVWENIRMIRRKGHWGAASGLEIDKVLDGSKLNWVPIAQGLNYKGNGRGEVYPEPIYESLYEWDGEGGADMGYYIHPEGGIVFNVNSLSFTGAIPYDRSIRQIMINVVNRMLSLPEE